MRTNFKSFAARIKKRTDGFLERRPHRSFRRTRRRDYKQSLDLPKSITFVKEVHKTLWRERRTFLLMAIVFTLLYIVMVGFIAQDEYTALSDTLKQTSSDVLTGTFGSIEQAGVLLLSLVGSATSSYGDEAQQVMSGLLFLLLWLSVVWFLRNRLAGGKAKLRDALYNSGAPLMSTLMVMVLIAIQTIPLAIAVIGYYAAASSGLLDSGIPAMLFWIGAALLAVLTFYWVSSSIFAMAIVTLPGVYPYKAIKSAGDIVLGRRVRIVWRWVVMFIVLALWWLVIMVPVILLEGWARSTWPVLVDVPIVPVVMVVAIVMSVIWVATYVYLLYRKVVDNVS